MRDHESETVIEIRKGSIKIIKYNKPYRKNAIDAKMYLRITKILNESAEDDNVNVTVLTGTGDYYSSGNDIMSTVESSKDFNMLQVLRDFIKAFITFPKLLIAVVNGPAIGIAATTLGLCDLVFASENSFFYTPFTKLGLVAEACSSFTFPRLLGDRKAAQMLLYNHKMTAKEALESGFINFIYKPEEMQGKVWDKIVEVSKLPTQSLTASKRLLRGSIQDQLIKTNENELEELNHIWGTEDYLNGIMNFVNRRSKM